MPARREVIRPEWDPIILTLDNGPEGVQREGKFGVDYQYIVNNDSAIMWLPKTGRDAIVATRARKGDQIEICKSQRGGYMATLLSDSREPERQQPQQQRQAAPQPPAPRSEQQQPAETSPLEQIMTSCLEVGAKANMRAYQRLIDAGIDVDKPIWEDFRATGISLFIERMRQMGGRS